MSEVLKGANDLFEIVGVVRKRTTKLDFVAEAFSEHPALLERATETTDPAEKKRLESEMKKFTLSERQKYVIIIEKLLKITEECGYGICRNEAFFYIYNGAY